MQLLRGDGDVVRVGHRGAARLAPENTVEAIEAAAAHGVDVVEVDVLRAAHGGLVLAHRPDVAADAPSLDDGLAAAHAAGVAVQLDVKVEGLESEAVGALRRHRLLDRAFVSSFSRPILRAFAAAEPTLPRSLTYPEDRHGITGVRLARPAVRTSLAVMRGLLPRRLPQLLAAVDASAATLNVGVVSRRAVEVCHDLGVAVYVWTVNDARVAETLVVSGIDGIITDDPRILPPGMTFRA